LQIASVKTSARCRAELSAAIEAMPFNPFQRIRDRLHRNDRRTDVTSAARCASSSSSSSGIEGALAGCNIGALLAQAMSIQGSGDLIQACSEEQARLDELVAKYPGKLLFVDEANALSRLVGRDQAMTAKGRLFVCRTTKPPELAPAQRESGKGMDLTAVLVAVQDTENNDHYVTLVGRRGNFWVNGGVGSTCAEPGTEAVRNFRLMDLHQLRDAQKCALSCSHSNPDTRITCGTYTSFGAFRHQPLPCAVKPEMQKIGVFILCS
jgi:hypothetical protein